MICVGTVTLQLNIGKLTRKMLVITKAKQLYNRIQNNGDFIALINLYDQIFVDIFERVTSKYSLQIVITKLSSDQM